MGSHSYALLTSAILAELFALKINAVRNVYQSVQNAVGRGGIADLRMPVGHRYLRSQNGGAGLIAIVADLQKIAAVAVVQRCHGPFIDHQHIGLDQPPQEPCETAVSVS